MGPSSLTQEGQAAAPTFQPMIKVPFGTEVGLRPGHIVLDGDPPAFPENDTAAPTFLPMSCGETVGWIKMPLYKEVSVGPGDTVLGEDPVTHVKGHSTPKQFGQCLLYQTVAHLSYC